MLRMAWLAREFRGSSNTMNSIAKSGNSDCGQRMVSNSTKRNSPADAGLFASGKWKIDFRRRRLAQ
jgi:hypothetical protein